MQTKPNVGAVAFSFKSQEDKYSYLKFDEQGVFKEAKEKKIISKIASVGTYLFRDAIVFLKALTWYFESGYDYQKNNLYYLCPMLNGVKLAGYSVQHQKVNNVFDIKN